jgi:hypothetical protein
MKINTILNVGTFAALTVSIALLLAPDKILGLFSAHTDGTGLVVTRILGVSVLGYALVGWYIKDLVTKVIWTKNRWLGLLAGVADILVDAWTADTPTKRSRKTTPRRKKSKAE